VAATNSPNYVKKRENVSKERHVSYKNSEAMKWNAAFCFRTRKKKKKDLIAGANAAVWKAVRTGKPWRLKLIAIFKRDLRLFFSLLQLQLLVIHELRKLSSVYATLESKVCVF